ncbi:hypothetical protein KIL84_012864 [Mauremys mutica]|uniref:Uncharacterized protein n=1 Tax=Mauremys mutica TaxID=74926 RepID=A0A9D3XRT7_9SAUR|nr:hypothetical protein KIL84_012864 [Mauremys mutica]
MSIQSNLKIKCSPFVCFFRTFGLVNFYSHKCLWKHITSLYAHTESGAFCTGHPLKYREMIPKISPQSSDTEAVKQDRQEPDCMHPLQLDLHTQLFYLNVMRKFNLNSSHSQSFLQKFNIGKLLQTRPT